LDNKEFLTVFMVTVLVFQISNKQDIRIGWLIFARMIKRLIFRVHWRIYQKINIL